jgi:hypothetical protein
VGHEVVEAVAGQVGQQLLGHAHRAQQRDPSQRRAGGGLVVDEAGLGVRALGHQKVGRTREPVLEGLERYRGGGCACEHRAGDPGQRVVEVDDRDVRGRLDERLEAPCLAPALGVITPASAATSTGSGRRPLGVTASKSMTTNRVAYRSGSLSTDLTPPCRSAPRCGGLARSILLTKANPDLAVNAFIQLIRLEQVA